MIPSRKPRGHFWTNASTFQQTDEFRNIRFGECVPSAARVLVEGSDESLSATERAAKRRRIERLADDFLNGGPLFISSARPPPELLKSTIVWNKKSSNEPKFVLPDVDRSRDSSALWQDVDNDYETLQKYKRSKQDGYRQSDIGERSDHGTTDEAVPAVKAQASCGPVPNNKILRVTDGPSEDALKQAALLRARRQQKAGNALAAIAPVTTPTTRSQRNNEEPQSKPKISDEDVGYRRASQWLSRRESRGISSNLALSEDSEDELRLSRIETPSTPSRRPTQSTPSQQFSQPVPRRRMAQYESRKIAIGHQGGTKNAGHSGRVHSNPLLRTQSSSSSDTIVMKSRMRHPLAVAESEHLIRKSTADNTSVRLSEQDSYETAPEVTDIHPAGIHERSQSQEGSDTTHSRDQEVQAVICGSGTSRARNILSDNEDSAQPQGMGSGNVSRSRTPKPLQKSAQVDAHKSVMIKRVDSSNISTRSQSTTTRQTRALVVAKPPRHTIHNRTTIGEQHPIGVPCVQTTYTNEEASQKGSTPFLWRKRGEGVPNSNGAKHGNLTPQAQQIGRRNLNTPSSGHGEQGARQFPTDHAQQVDSNPPVLDISFDHDLSFAPKLDIALVNEQLHANQSRGPGTCHQALSVKSSQPCESEPFIADNNRSMNEPPISPQAESEAHCAHNAALQPHWRESNGDNQERTVASQLWLGTQAMLHQAQKDLFTSPEKREAECRGDNTRDGIGIGTAATEPPPTSARKPLKQLSQKPMPSTQVILDNFEGFSTVKKPRGTDRASPLPTPTGRHGAQLGKHSHASSSSLVTPVLPISKEDPTRGPSRLRFSLSSVDSPHRSVGIDRAAQSATVLSTTSVATRTPTPISIMKTSSNTDSARRSSDRRQGSSSIPYPSEHWRERDATQSFASFAVLPSFEAAQGRASLSRDDSELDRTVDNLTDFLSMKDMEGVLSQPV